MPSRAIRCPDPMVRAALKGRKSQIRVPLSSQWTVDGSRSQRALNRLDWQTAETRTQSALMLAMVGRQAPYDPHLSVQANDGETCHRVRPPYDIGDMLFVLEAWAPIWDLKINDIGPEVLRRGCVYRADGDFKRDEVRKWTPSIRMPQAASRLTLIVKRVRIERLQDISPADAKAEGLSRLRGRYFIEGNDHSLAGYGDPDPKRVFKAFWDSTHKQDGNSWDENPWVAVIDFKAHPRVVLLGSKAA